MKGGSRAPGPDGCSGEPAFIATSRALQEGAGTVNTEMDPNPITSERIHMGPDELLAPCPPVEPVQGVPRTDRPTDPLIARLTIEGLRCQHCATRIGNALGADPGVLGLRVDLEGGLVDVLFDARRLSTDDLASLIVSSADGSPRHYEVTHVETA